MSLLLAEAFYGVAFTIYGDFMSVIYHLLFTVLLTGGLIYLGRIGAELDLSMNGWIKHTWYEWYNLFTTRHYFAWLYDRNRRAWLKLIVLVGYSLMAELVFLLIGNSVFENRLDAGMVWLIIGSMWYSICLPFSTWLFLNIYRRF